MRKVKKATKKAAGKSAKKVRCSAKTKSGKPCKRFTSGKGKLCSVHK